MTATLVTPLFHVKCVHYRSPLIHLVNLTRTLSPMSLNLRCSAASHPIPSLCEVRSRPCHGYAPRGGRPVIRTQFLTPLAVTPQQVRLVTMRGASPSSIDRSVATPRSMLPRVLLCFMYLGPNVTDPYTIWDYLRGRWYATEFQY